MTTKFIVTQVLLLLCCIFVQAQVKIGVTWPQVEAQTNSTATYILVINPLLGRGSPIYNQVYNLISDLKADRIRYLFWRPYPQLGVAELSAPASAVQCSEVPIGANAYLECDVGVFSDIQFASFGTPTGTCGSFRLSSCNSPLSTSVVREYCVGKKSCLIPATTAVFGDYCPGVDFKVLSVQLRCEPYVNKTFWNFDLIDPFMEDFMNAAQPPKSGLSHIINFSTIPQWQWVTDSPVTYPNEPNEVTWLYSQGLFVRDPSLAEVTSYFSRLIQWYTNGGFVDEFGVKHTSNHFYNITYWEVLNEIEVEHYMTPQYYTFFYDLITLAMLKVRPELKFFGLVLALASSDNYGYYTYFLDKRNHLPGVPLDYISYHWYANCTSRDQPKDFESFFPQADAFFEEVRTIEQIRLKLSPTTKVAIDEIGVILPDDLDVNPSPIAPLYWNANGANYVYVYVNLAKLGIDMLHMSQLVGYPSQFPSVTMMNWTTGEPTARYWILKLVMKYFNSDKQTYMHPTTVTNSNAVFAQGFTSSIDNKKRFVVLNKLSQSVTVAFSDSSIVGATAEYVDESTGSRQPSTVTLKSQQYTLSPFGVAFITYA